MIVEFNVDVNVSSTGCYLSNIREKKSSIGRVLIWKERPFRKCLYSCLLFWETWDTWTWLKSQGASFRFHCVKLQVKLICIAQWRQRQTQKNEARDKDRLIAAGGICGNPSGELAYAQGADAGGDHAGWALQRQGQEQGVIQEGREEGRERIELLGSQWCKLNCLVATMT